MQTGVFLDDLALNAVHNRKVELTVGPVVKAFIEYSPEGDEAQLVELRLPFIPRVGEDIGFGPPGNRRYGRVQGVHWVFAQEDEDGIVRVQNVNIHVEPFDHEESNGN